MPEHQAVAIGASPRGSRDTLNNEIAKTLHNIQLNSLFGQSIATPAGGCRRSRYRRRPVYLKQLYEARKCGNYGVFSKKLR